MDPTNAAVLAVRPQPRLLQGNLSPEDVDLATRWVAANAAALIEYWDGDLSTVEFVHRLKKV